MASFKIGNLSVGSPEDPVFVIAEIGQNHQGNIEIAKKLIDAAKRIGCNCVKFQKSSLREKFTQSALNRPYTGPNSWGATYGDHKFYLEFSINQLRILKNYCKDMDIYFSASAMDEVSLEELQSLDLPFIKVGSGDANNYSLLEKAARMQCPLIISTGMQTMSTIETIVQIMKKSGKTNFALLHCVSSYPTKPEDCNLLTIPLLRKKFPDVLIGYSGHEVAPYISEAAVLLGAKIIERHITLDKLQKGSDHMCSLTPTEFESLIKNIRSYQHIKLLKIPQSTHFIINHFNGNEDIKKSLVEISDRKILNCELDCRKKLGKSLVTAKVIHKGDMLTLENIKIKVSEPPGLTAERLRDCIGQVANKDLNEDVPLQCDDIAGFE